MTLAELLKEGGRQFTICNACRYCEGYCAVFPAMELLTKFERKDVLHLANLCHDCRACYYACMYAPPHEFAVNIPAVLSAVRDETHRTLSFPSFMSALSKGTAHFSLLTMIGVGLVLVLLFVFGLSSPPGAPDASASPYRILPYPVMLVTFAALGGYAVLATIAGAMRYWGAVVDRPPRRGDLAAAIGALSAATSLRYLRGGPDGCYYPDERPRHGRRRFHHLVFYGFIADLGATISAAILQDILGIPPPYPLLSVPVMLGSVGGAAIIIGSLGLARLKRVSDTVPASPRMIDADRALLLALLLVSVTGFLSLFFRETVLSGAALVVHLGTVAALFLFMPYGKFVHFMYRYLALVKREIDERVAARGAMEHER